MQFMFSHRSTATKAVAISFGLMSCQRLSGVSAVIYYTVDIFRGAGTTLAPTTATIAVGLSQVAASATSALLVDKLGRRFLLLLSNVVMAASLAVMVLYSSYREQGIYNHSFYNSSLIQDFNKTCLKFCLKKITAITHSAIYNK